METAALDQRVPGSLRTWFVVHFAVDILFGLPLLIAPTLVLPLFGWTNVDALTSRLVGAALMGIGIESFLGRNAGKEAYRGMLNLKVIWASCASLGIGLSLLVEGAPPVGWAILAIFIGFGALWAYYRTRLA